MTLTPGVQDLASETHQELKRLHPIRPRRGNHGPENGRPCLSRSGRLSTGPPAASHNRSQREGRFGRTALGHWNALDSTGSKSPPEAQSRDSDGCNVIMGRLVGRRTRDDTCFARSVTTMLDTHAEPIPPLSVRNDRMTTPRDG